MKYKEIEIIEEDNEDREKMNASQIVSIHGTNMSDALFINHPGSALWIAYDVPYFLRNNIIGLSETVDWVIRKYRGKLYLISLKKDC